MALPRSSIFQFRRKSLLRGIVLALGSFAASLRLAGFPRIENLHGSPWQALAAAASVWGMVETGRCLDRKRWSLYHAGVLILLYADLMIVAMTIFLWAFL